MRLEAPEEENSDEEDLHEQGVVANREDDHSEDHDFEDDDSEDHDFEDDEYIRRQDRLPDGRQKGPEIDF